MPASMSTSSPTATLDKVVVAPKAKGKRERRGLFARLQRVLTGQVKRRQAADLALRRAEHKYRSIFEHALEGIFQTTADGKYIAANPALIRMYGYDSFEQLAGTVDDIATQIYVDPKRRDEFVRLMKEQGQVLHFESEVCRRDGQRLWISENVRSIHDDDGKFLYYEGTIDDITELKAAYEKQRQTFEALERTQQCLEGELKEAAGYVRSLLPAPLRGEIETHWCYIPSSHLGGDGFGYHWIDPDNLAVYLLDVSGHGVGSALLGMSVLNVLRSQSLAAADFHDPSAVLRALNQAFPMASNNEKYFTIWYGVFHRRSRQLSYATGGHHGAVLLSPGADGPGMQGLQTAGAVIGVVADLEYPCKEIEVPPGGVLYVFSDGVYEIARPDGSWQSWQELAAFLQAKIPDIEEIVQRMRDERGSEVFEDDFSLLQMKLK